VLGSIRREKWVRGRPPAGGSTRTGICAPIIDEQVCLTTTERFSSLKVENLLLHTFR
jgi:hypothetical protein